MHIHLMDDKLGYELVRENEQVGHIVWKLDGNVMVMDGTYVHESLRGQDMGEKLLDQAAEYAREYGYKMKPVCPYVVKMFDRHSKYDDVKK